MKKFSILLMAFLTIATISCDDNDEELFIDGPESQLAFTSTAASSYLLTFDTRANTAERFVWSTVDFATPIAVNYEIQASADPSNFDDSVVLTSTNENSAAVTVERLNEVALMLGLTPFSEDAIAVRVVGTTADVTMEPMVSENLVLAVTPYTTEAPRVWVPGNYASASGYGPDWAPDNDATPYLEAVEFGSTEYEGFVFMNVAAPEFKITPEMNWDNAYGDAGSGLISLSAGDNLTAPGPGYYFIQVNTDPDGDPSTDDATISVSERQWGIIGEATTPSNSAGWGDELDMVYDEVAKTWSVELDMQAGEFKFRAQQWDPATYNFGAGEEANQLSFGAGNLSVGATGRYRAVMDLSTPRNYTYELISI